MLSFGIEEDDIKVFMQKLLQEKAFDELEVRSIYIDKIVKYDIDCSMSQGNSSNNLEDNKQTIKNIFIKWADIKPNILNIIKGNQKPRQLKIVFCLSEDKLLSLTDNASAMFLNISYSYDINTTSLTGTTAISQKSFNLEKKEENIWEDFVINFFRDNNINIVT
ncbi:MAG: DUF5721 family protein [bacterium]